MFFAEPSPVDQAHSESPRTQIPARAEQELALALFGLWADGLGLETAELHGLLADPCRQALDTLLRIEIDVMILAATDLCRSPVNRRHFYTITC